MFTINDYLMAKTFRRLVSITAAPHMSTAKDAYKWVRCADGLRFSVQASSSSMCEPCEDYPENGWTHVEVFEHDIPEFNVFAEYDGEPAKVPVTMVDIIIERHGGFATDIVLALKQERLFEIIVKRGYPITNGTRLWWALYPKRELIEQYADLLENKFEPVTLWSNQWWLIADGVNLYRMTRHLFLNQLNSGDWEEFKMENEHDNEPI